MALISLFGLLSMVGGGVGLFVLNEVYLLNPVTLTIGGLALGLMIWARKTFGSRSFNPLATPTEGGLVTYGPYRYIRHPIYTAACLLFLGFVAAHPSVQAMGLEGLVLIGAVLRMVSEEKALVLQYPEYASYMTRTQRMIPYLY